MRLITGVIGSIALAAALVGCSSAPAGPTLAPGQTATPAPPAGATATPAPVGVTGHECDAVPTFSLSNPIEPSFPADPQAEAHFPATIDGQPVTDVQSQQWLYFLCYLGGQAQFEQAMNQGGGGVNMATSSFAQANATVDGEEVDLTAWRTPGTDANQLVQHLGVLAAQAGGELNPGNVQSGNVGGKNVYFWTDEDGTKGYAYPSGDTLIFFENVTDSQATKILTALQ